MDPTATKDFTDEQKHYLQGFVAGSGLAQSYPAGATFAGALGLAPDQLPGGGRKPHGGDGTELPAGPEAVHFRAQDRIVAEGGKLCAEEQAKRKRFPLDVWDDVRQHAAENRAPRGTDVLAFKYHGLFWVAPAQDSFMTRLRFAGGIVPSYQLRGVADLAERHGGGYADVTTRANLQIREIKPADTVNVIEGLHDLGVINRGAGADNIRNITGSPTAGIDPRELIDTRPLTKELHHYILNHRELYGLPRKFNVAFDGGGAISALEDTNDIGFTAVRVPSLARGAEREGASPAQGTEPSGSAAGSSPSPATESQGSVPSEINTPSRSVPRANEVPPGVYFRLTLGGITGHKDFARDTGILLRPEECLPVACAILRVFIEHGDRTDRKKARLKYLLDKWGFDKFIAEAEKLLPFPLRRFDPARCEPRPPVEPHGHVGWHRQRQDGLWYVGVVLPVARMRSAQMRGLADLADRHGSGTIRLTVWQNLLISDIPEDRIETVKRELESLGLAFSASHVRGGLVACTGAAGCKYASADTKRHGLMIADHLDGRVELDQPINIHLTGCPHSCAQHFIGDVGLLATKVPVGEGDDADMVEGYHLFVGGGYGARRHIGRQVYANVVAEEVPPLLERVLRAYLEHRASPAEPFAEFTRRLGVEALKEMFDRVEAAV